MWDPCCSYTVNGWYCLVMQITTRLWVWVCSHSCVYLFMMAKGAKQRFLSTFEWIHASPAIECIKCMSMEFSVVKWHHKRHTFDPEQWGPNCSRPLPNVQASIQVVHCYRVMKPAIVHTRQKWCWDSETVGRAHTGPNVSFSRASWPWNPSLRP